MADVEAIKEEIGFATKCVHGGYSLDAQGGIHAPLYSHSTFGFSSTQGVLDVVEGRSEGNLYTRYGMNPTIKATERKLAGLEGAEHALLFASGMAAESAVFMAHSRAGQNIVCIGDVYGGTFELLSENLPQLGISTTFLLGDELDRLPEVLDEQTSLVFFETPTNPNLEVLDISLIAGLAKEKNILTVVDNTFASPLNQNPLLLGADIVVHSATKYLGGHSDLTGGAVMGSKEVLQTVSQWRKSLGQVCSPETASLLDRSLRTLVVRVERQNQTAEKIARFLSEHPSVLKVNHPSLLTEAAGELARNQMKGFGGMVSFVYDGDAEQTAAVVDRLQVFTIAASLGGVESLVTQPVTTTHHGMKDDDRQRRGIVGGLVRLSVGLEDAEDLIRDLKRALSAP